MTQARVFVIVAVLYHIQWVASQFPRVCMDDKEMVMRKKCCPHSCFRHLNRGKCVEVKIKPFSLKTKIYDTDMDKQRLEWPTHFFTRVCHCYEHFDGYDCSECKPGYTGKHCQYKRKLVIRKNILHITDHERRQYFNALKKLLDTNSDYVVMCRVTGSKRKKEKEIETESKHNDDKSSFSKNSNTTTRNNRGESLYDYEYKYNFMPVSEYGLLVWLHAYASEPAVGQDENYAHGSSAFPLWHRSFILQVENKLQKISGNASLAVPYWDWRDGGGNCSVCQDHLFGSQDEHGYLQGQFFSLWKNSEFPCITTFQQEGNPSYSKVTRKPGSNKDCICLPTHQDVECTFRYPRYEPPYDTLNNTGQKYEYNYDTPSGFRSAMEGNFELLKSSSNHKYFVHNKIHCFMGEDSSFYESILAPNDPLFFSHHAFVDMLVEEWLRRNNYPNPIDRLKGIPIVGAIPGHNYFDNMVPFFPPVKPHEMFRKANRLGYSYDDIKGYFHCDKKCQKDTDKICKMPQKMTKKTSMKKLLTELLGIIKEM